MSSNLYYTLQNDTGFKLVGRDTFFALETEYRIKVGGQEILPWNDIGLFKKWVGYHDDFLVKIKSQNNDLPTDLDGKRNITVVMNSDHVAPKELYTTTCDMDTNANLKKISNLTW